MFSSASSTLMLPWEGTRLRYWNYLMWGHHRFYWTLVTGPCLSFFFSKSCSITISYGVQLFRVLPPKEIRSVRLVPCSLGWSWRCDWFLPEKLERLGAVARQVGSRCDHWPSAHEMCDRPSRLVAPRRAQRATSSVPCGAIRSLPAFLFRAFPFNATPRIEWIKTQISIYKWFIHHTLVGIMLSLIASHCIHQYISLEIDIFIFCL